LARRVANFWQASQAQGSSVSVRRSTSGDGAKTLARTTAEGIEAMPREEAAYWLGVAMHRRYPRRVLKALRCLLTDPGYFC
jgi:hypothetical protein